MAPPAPVVLVLVEFVVLIEFDERVVDVLELAVCPLVLLATVTVLATAALSVLVPLTMPEESSSLPHAPAASGIISTRSLQVSELYGKPR